MLSKELLHRYQKVGVKHVIDNTSAGLLMQMGLGKTVTVLTAIDYLIYSELEIASVLVVAPKRVIESVWAQEAKQWEHLQHLKTVRIIGTQKQRRRALEEKADIYLISRDNLAWLIGEYGGLRLPYDMLVLDESSSFKNHKSVRFKALKKVLASFDRRVILTGTPSPNGLVDIWAQIYCLDLGERLSKFITRFRQQFFTKGAHLYSKHKINKGAERIIYERIGDICLSMKSADYLDLPKRVTNYIEIDFPPALKRKYETFEEAQILELVEDDITALNAAALMTKLMQFANGAIYGNPDDEDDSQEVHEIHDLKLKALEEIVEAAQGEPVLVAWTFRHDRDRIMKHLKKYHVVQLDDDEDIQAWNRKEIQVLLMHPASGGHGLNLQKGGHNIVWYGMNWSLELYEQFNARLDRQGQTHPVTVNHLIGAGTIDEDVVKALSRKSAGQAALMNAVKAKIHKYGLNRS